MAGGSTEDHDQASAARWLQVPGLGWLTRVDLWLEGSVLTVRRRSPGFVEVTELPVECVEINRRHRLRGATLVTACLLLGSAMALLFAAVVGWPLEDSIGLALLHGAMLVLGALCGLASLVMAVWFLVPRVAVTCSLPEPWDEIGFWLMGREREQVEALLERVDQVQQQLAESAHAAGDAVPVMTPLAETVTSWWLVALMLVVYVVTQAEVLAGSLSAWWLLLVPMPLAFLLLEHLCSRWNEPAELRRARRQLQDRRPEVALAVLDQLLEHDPGNLGARWMRVEALAASGRRQQALAAMNDGLDLLEPDEAAELLERIELRIAIADRRKWQGDHRHTRCRTDRAVNRSGRLKA